MPNRPRNKPFHVNDDAFFAIKRRKPVPFEFVLEALAPLSPLTHSMFGCLAVYIEDKIVLILREKSDQTSDNGVWLATTRDHHESLRRDFPNMRSIRVLGAETTGWQVLPADAPDFEESVLRACDLIAAGDPRIGKVPGARDASKSKSRSPAKSAMQRTPKRSANRPIQKHSR